MDFALAQQLQDNFHKITMSLIADIFALELRVQRLEFGAATSRRRPRDGNKRRVYLCDKALAAQAAPLPDIADVRRYIEAAFATEAIREAFPKATAEGPPAVSGKERKAAHANAVELNILMRYRNEAIVLHELAHVICKREDAFVSAHGPEFCATYIKLVSIMMGQEAADVLQAAMKANGVRQ